MKQQRLISHGLWALVLGLVLSACWGKKEEEAPADAAPTEQPADAPADAAPADGASH